MMHQYSTSWLSWFIGTLIILALGMGISESSASECPFEFEYALTESTGSGRQVLTEEGQLTQSVGNWIPINELQPFDRVRQFARAVGRLDVCARNKHGETEIATCTANLLDDNKILTNAHCTDLSEILRKRKISIIREGWEIAEARLLMGFESAIRTNSVRYYRVSLDQDRKISPNFDAQVLHVFGSPNIEWGHIPINIANQSVYGQRLVIIHHPAGIVKHFNPFGCYQHRGPDTAKQQDMAHSCDTMGGSSGALLLRESDLAIVALHFAGGKRGNDDDSFNRAYRFVDVARSLGLRPTGDVGNYGLNEKCDLAEQELGKKNWIPQEEGEKLKIEYQGCSKIIFMIDRLMNSISPPFNVSRIDPNDLRIIQAALIITGDYKGMIDGRWGHLSQRSLDNFVYRTFGQLVPRYSHIKDIIVEFYQIYRDEGWRPFYLSDVDISISYPSLIVTKDVEPERNQITFASRNRDLIIRWFVTTRSVAHERHAWAKEHHNGEVEPYYLRLADRMVTAVQLVNGQKLYLRTEKRRNIYVTLLIQGDSHHDKRIALIASSFVLGDQEPLTVIGDGYLNARLQ